MSDRKEPDFSVSIYEEIESWPERYRLKLIEKLLERECTHGDHPHGLKDKMIAVVHHLRQYEYEGEGHVCISFSDEVGKTEDELRTYKIPERVQKKLNAEADLIDQASMGSQVEAPWWAGKDVVGMLLRRGWKLSADGLTKMGPGMLSDLHIPAKDIIECYEVPEQAADRLEAEAKRRKETP